MIVSLKTMMVNNGVGDASKETEAAAMQQTSIKQDVGALWQIYDYFSHQVLGTSCIYTSTVTT